MSMMRARARGRVLYQGRVPRRGQGSSRTISLNFSRLRQGANSSTEFSAQDERDINAVNCLLNE
jgi:hypothetical protein